MKEEKKHKKFREDRAVRPTLESRVDIESIVIPKFLA
jgi:hypothetical protein